MKKEDLEKLKAMGRRMGSVGKKDQTLEAVVPGALEGLDDAPLISEAMGPLQHLPGEWRSLPGRGWNMIALPFATPGSRLNYRLLMNQYDEVLKFDFIDAGVPNRGISITSPTTQTDQSVTALDYEQSVTQVESSDFPASGLPSDNGKGIHREPGLWLNMLDQQTDDIDIARLATVPHGDSVLALGRSKIEDGLASIPDLNGMPTGVSCNIDHPYLAPYKHFIENPFRGNVPANASGFPGFSPVNPNILLQEANAALAGRVKKTTILHVDTTIASGGISNIPFVVKQANATDMASTFWIYELNSPDANGSKFMLQYSQTVFLDFFPTIDGTPGLIRWPHVSINTLVKNPS